MYLKLTQVPVVCKYCYHGNAVCAGLIGWLQEPIGFQKTHRFFYAYSMHRTIYSMKCIWMLTSGLATYPCQRRFRNCRIRWSRAMKTSCSSFSTAMDWIEVVTHDMRHLRKFRNSTPKYCFWPLFRLLATFLNSFKLIHGLDSLDGTSDLLSYWSQSIKTFNRVTESAYLWLQYVNLFYQVNLTSSVK